MIHPQFDPIAIQIGPLAVHWYGLMYLMAFMQYLFLGRLRVKQPQMREKGFIAQDIEDLLFGIDKPKDGEEPPNQMTLEF